MGKENDMRHYKAILLDLDNTLYDYPSAHKKAIECVYSYLFLNLNIIREVAEPIFVKAREYVNYHLKGTAASHNRLLYFQRLCELLDLNSAPTALILYNTYWDHFLDAMKPFPYMKKFLKSWSTLGNKICILTDLTAHIQYRKISKLGIQNFINYIVTSEEVGYEKPDSKIFLTALEKLNAQKDEVIMIGDNYEKDILGAQKLEISYHWFSSNEKILNNIKTVNFKTLYTSLL